jgi:hypothetical protein
MPLTLDQVKSMAAHEIFSCNLDEMVSLYQQSRHGCVLSALLLLISRNDVYDYARARDWLLGELGPPTLVAQCVESDFTWFHLPIHGACHVLWFTCGRLVKFGTISDEEYHRIAIEIKGY